jgi:hypothetical protein
MNTTQQKRFALALLRWHDSQSCPIYAVGSCMLSDSDKGRDYDPRNHRGHADTEEEQGAVSRAIRTLRRLKADANFPECVTAKDEKDAERLALRLEKLKYKFTP